MPRILPTRSALIVALLCLAPLGGIGLPLRAQESSQSHGDGLAAQGDPFRAVQEALLLNNHSEARTLLDAITPKGRGIERTRTSAQKALLSVALTPDIERARRYLAVATTYSQEPAGLTALVAALHSMKLQREMAWYGDDESLAEELEDLESPSAPAVERDLSQALNVAEGLLEAWRLREPDLPEIDWAHALIESNRQAVTRRHLRIGSGGTLPLPSPLGEALIAKVYTWPESATSFGHFQGMARRGDLEPAFSYELGGKPKESDQASPQLPSIPRPAPGRYVIEIQSKRNGWKDSRTVTVSDLILSAHHTPDALIVLATLNKQPQPGVVIKLGDRSVTTDPSGKAIIPLAPKAEGRKLVSGTYTNTSGTHRASLKIYKTIRNGSKGNKRNYTAHWMIDRPIYRAGETLHGRVVIRRHMAVPLPSLVGTHGESPRSEPVVGLSGYVEVKFGDRSRTKVNVRTDDMGVASFGIPIPSSAKSGDLRIAVHGLEEGPEESKSFFIGSAYQGRVMDFRPPPLLLTLEGAPSASRREDVEFQVNAAWPWGSPAPYLEGHATLRIGALSHVIGLVLDANGQARIVAKIADLPLVKRDLSLFCRASVFVNDGQLVTQSTTTKLRSGIAPKGSKSARPLISNRSGHRQRLRLSVDKKQWKEGETVRIRVSGRPSCPVLVSAAREALFHSQVVVLDAKGEGFADLKLQPGWAPTMSIAASLTHSSGGYGAMRGGGGYWWNDHAARLTLSVVPQNHELKIQLERDQEAYGPGSRARWTMSVRDASGNPVQATLALSVVDETLFNLARDGLSDPTTSLMPKWKSMVMRWALGAGLSDPWLVLGELLNGGVVAPPSLTGNIGLGGGAGGSDGGRAGGKASLGGSVSLREDFRATAFWFPNLRTDQDGTVSFEANFPDNLTTWRITACAVDRGIRGGVDRFEVRTKKDFSANLITPRLLRSGDTLALPLALAQESDGETTKVSLATNVSGGLVHRGEAVVTGLTTQPGASLTHPLSLQAPELATKSDGIVELTLSNSATRDALDRTKQRIPLLPRTIYRSTTDVALVEKSATLQPTIPEGASFEGATTEIEVLGSIDAIMAQASEWLDSYPYGCAEQTASKLTSVLIAARGRRSRALTPYSPDPEPLSDLQVHRLEAGYARLRSLQTGSGGFAWWTDGRDDLEVSAYVFRTLALAQSSELKPEQFGIRTGAQLIIFKQAVTALEKPAKTARIAGRPMPIAMQRILEPDDEDSRRERVAALSHCELATTLLLLNPSHRRALGAMRTLALAADRLPIGLTSRVGLALVKAGERNAASQVFNALKLRSSNLSELSTARSQRGLLAEDPSVLLSGLLRLCVLCDGPREFADRCLVALMRRNQAGRFDHTLGTANALLAMTEYCFVYPQLSPSEATPRITIIRDGKPRQISLDSETDLRAKLTIPAGPGAISIQASEGLRPLVTATSRFPLDGANTKGWQTPLSVTRSLYRPSNSIMQQELIRNKNVRLGEVLTVSIKVRASPALSRLLITCPIPAGFEVIPGRGLVVTDSEVQLGVLSLNKAGQAHRSFRMIASMLGRVAWPSAQAEAMYEPAKAGASQGGWLNVLEPAPLWSGSSIGKVAGLDPAHCTKLFNAAEEKVLEALTHSGAMQAARSLSKLPLLVANRWAATDAGLSAMAEHLSEARIARSWLRLCGEGTQRYLSGEGLERLIRNTRLPRDEAIPYWARIIASSKLTRDVFLFPPATRLEARVHGLATAQSDFDPKGFSDPSEKMQLVLRWFAAEDFQGEAADKAIVQRERMSHHGGAPWIAKPMNELVGSTWTQSGLAHERDPAEAITATQAIINYASSLQSLWLEGNRHTKRCLTDTMLRILAEPTQQLRGGAESTEYRKYKLQLMALARPVSNVSMKRLLQLTPKDHDFDETFELALLCPKALRRERTLETFNRLLDPKLQQATDRESWISSIDTALGLSKELGNQQAAFRIPALSLLGMNEQEFWARAWNLLNAADKAAFPTERLISLALHSKPRTSADEEIDDDFDEEPSEVQDWALNVLWKRGPKVRAALLRNLNDLGSYARSELLDRASIEELKTLSLNSLLEGLVAEEVDYDSHPLFQAAMTRGFTFDYLARALADPRNVLARRYLIKLIAGCRPAPKRSDLDRIPWGKSDRTANRWRTLVEARMGRKFYRSMVLKWMNAPSAPSMPDEDWALHWWVLSPGLERSDLMAFEPQRVKAESSAIARILETMSTDELCALWTTERSTFLQHLSAKTAARILDRAIHAWRLGEGTALKVLRRAQSSTLASALLPILHQLDDKQVKAILSVTDGRRTLALSIYSELAAHPSATVRIPAAEALYLLTGIPRTVLDAEGKPKRFTPNSQSEAHTAVSTQLRTHGIQALESLLQSPNSRLRTAAKRHLAKRGIALR